jgi:hypothetical protein
VTGEVSALGDSVLSSAVRAEPVRTREEVRLEHRLQHQLQGCLDHPVRHRRDPQTTELAVRLRDHPLTHRNRPETAPSQLRPQPVEEALDSLPGLDGVCGSPVHSGRAGTLVSPDPVPRHQKERGVGHEVEQIVEPAMRIIVCPTVQLGLDLQYPQFRPEQGGLQLIGVHRRQPPGIPASLLPTCWLPSPCGRLSRPPSTTEPPSCPAAISRRRACPRPDWRSGTEGDRGQFPRSPQSRSTGEVPSSTPAASPHLRRRHSVWPPHR